MKSAEELFGLLAAASEKKGDRLLKSEWLALVGDFLGAKAPAKTKPAITDDEWLDEIARSPAYQGVDVRREVEKCRVWAAANRQIPSRRRIVSWLNRAEKSVTFGNPQTPVAKAALPEPANWKNFVRENFLNTTYADKPWPSLEHAHQKWITEEMGKAQ